MTIDQQTKTTSETNAVALGLATMGTKQTPRIDQKDLGTVGLNITPKVIQTYSAVYPLENLTAVRVEKIVFPNPSLKITFLIGFLTMSILTVIFTSMTSPYDTSSKSTITFFCMILGIIASVYWYQSRKARIPDLYALIADASGMSRNVIVSMNAPVLHQALRCIDEALQANLLTPISFQITNSVIAEKFVGDNIYQHGDHNIGKQEAPYVGQH